MRTASPISLEFRKRLPFEKERPVHKGSRWVLRTYPGGQFDGEFKAFQVKPGIGDTITGLVEAPGIGMAVDESLEFPYGHFITTVGVETRRIRKITAFLRAGLIGEGNHGSEKSQHEKKGGDPVCCVHAHVLYNARKNETKQIYEKLSETYGKASIKSMFLGIAAPFGAIPGFKCLRCGVISS